VARQFCEHGSGVITVDGAVEVTEPLFYAISDRHIGVRVTELEEKRKSLGGLVVNDEGAFCLLARTSSLKHLRQRVRDPVMGSSPLKAQRPANLAPEPEQKQRRT
jgi:hypothetical protein